jgi:hypothetical protein
MLCPIFMCNIDFEMDLIVFEVLNKSIVHKEAMYLLPFKGGIQVVYILWLKWSRRHLSVVRPGSKKCRDN